MDYSKFGNPGGGFFNDTNQFDSPTQNKKSKTPKKAQNVFPVFIGQIHNCLDDEFTIFGMNVQMVCITAILKKVEVQSTKVVYEIEDHTGSISALLWLDNENTSSGNLPPVKEGNYVCVYGIVRKHDSERNLMVMKMLPVDNYNDVITHSLSVIRARCATKMRATRTELPSAMQANNPGIQFANAMNIHNDNKNNTPGMSSIKEKIFTVLRPCTDEIGFTKKYVLDKFPANQHREVSEMLRYLAMEGHIYTTIDEDHLKITSSM